MSSSSGRRWAFASSLLLLMAFIPVLSFDHEIFLFLNGLHTPATDVLWLSFTTLGDGLLLTIILGCFLLVNPRVTVFGLLLMLVSGVVIHVIKAVYVLPRPAELLSAAHVIGPLLRSGAFPSGHTASSISAALTIAYLANPRWLGPIAVFVAGMTSVSRIFVAAHFPKDVLGAAIIVLVLFIIFVVFVWPKIEHRIPSTPPSSALLWRLALLAEILAAVFALTVYSLRFAEFPPVSAAVAAAVLGFLAARYSRIRCRSLP